VTTFFCTANMAKTLKVALSPSTTVPKWSWYLRSFRYQRKKVYLAVHMRTLFAVSVIDVKGKDVLPALKEKLKLFLDYYGIENFTADEAFNLDKPEFFKTLDRRIISTVNRLAMEFEYYMWIEEEEFGPLFMDSALKRMHTNIFTLTDYRKPLEMILEE
jgi:hypothetical protein